MYTQQGVPQRDARVCSTCVALPCGRRGGEVGWVWLEMRVAVCGVSAAVRQGYLRRWVHARMYSLRSGDGRGNALLGLAA